ncbi:DUF2254 domain-containing protein [Nocardioides sambongensis]|uniref:DUF2254 domain-containing protein n=1 Tax=Nocardioides sambongensis TaxID=2589074 RepID=UPI001126F226|nr:DUF2254 domain-containing protein [Nocardioides sambongensis]
MSIWFDNVRDAFRTRLWPLPTIAVVFALLLGLALPELDSVIDDDLPGRVGGWLFGGDADAARSLLGAIASSMITVTALTFSLTVVTLQLASSQFSPRLLRTFTRDLFVQLTLALFLATFTYALTVLRAVRGSEEEGGVELVPKVAVTLAFVLAVASVLGLVLFLAHLTEQIRVETMLRTVHRDAVATMQTVLAERNPAGGDPTPVPSPPPEALTLLAEHDGFLTWIDQKGLLDIAVEEQALLRIEVHPGAFLVKGTPLGSAWSTEPGRLSDEVAERIATGVAGCIHVGFERTSAQDVGYGLRQLTDVVNKALSPGINDPTTAIHALGHTSAFLCALSDHDLGPEVLRDDDDEIRVVMQRPDLASYVDLGLSQPRRYGAADPQVLQRIFQVLLDLSHRVAPDQRSVVRDELERLSATVASQPFDPMERAGLESMGHQIRQNLEGPSDEYGAARDG